MRTILEEENLIKDAYIQEIKHSFTKFAKSIEDTITLAPEIKKFLDENRSIRMNQKPRSNVLLSGSILSSSIFIGSTFLYSLNETLSIAGMIGALFVMGIFAVFRKR